MVKVHEEAAMTAEPTSSSTTPSNNVRGGPPAGRAPLVGNGKFHHHHHHHHSHIHSPFQHFPHFHHHWPFPNSGGSATVSSAGPSSSSSSSSPGVATFHFGPGFEPQQRVSPPFVAVSSSSSGTESAPPSSATGPPQHVVEFHVNPGVTVSLQIGDNHQVLKGPVTVPMVSTNSSPPIPMPVQVPPGHMVQQIVDETGTLRHVILSPQPPIVPMQQHYGPGPGNGPNQPPQPYYNPQGLPPGYPPPHFAHANPLQMGHVPVPNQQGHSPPPHNFHKDERTHRQYIKLKKKLEQKQMRGDGLSINSPHGTPPISPRKELVNGLRRSKERGMSSVGTSEDGEESNSMQDEEEEVHLITEMLSTVKSPQVAELSSRSALLHWLPPDRLTEQDGTKSPELDVAETDLRYEVLLSDKGKEGKYKSIYSGVSLSCRIQDLKPGTEYSVCVQVHLDELQGSASEPATFTTPSCEPDQPQPPKLISRTRTNLQLRWNATVDNGSHIAHYILECDDGKGKGFVEIYKSRGKQHNVMKLQQSTCYKFRLAAINECGKSPYSDVVSYSTSGSPPGQPAPPVLKEASVRSLHLTWQRRPNDEDFSLQMNDRESGHGFLPVYNGKEPQYLCEQLRRHTDFKFRLRASNDEGPSRWSEEVCYRTLPDRPAQPPRPGVKGRIHSQSFRAKWDPPMDRGGADITNYILELNDGNGYRTVYSGGDTECLCDRLTPGSTYQLRVSCISMGGRSDFSEPCSVTTEPVCPGRCAAPRLHGKPRATSVSLKWGYPEYDGGASVTEFEVEVLCADESRRQVYRGSDTECAVGELGPGQTYVFQLRANNRVGSGPWSEPLEVVSGAAPPHPPAELRATCRSPHAVLVSWQEPPANGAPLTDYRLEMASGEDFTTVFQGSNNSHEVKGLTPATTYHFRIQACNSAGWSGLSEATEVSTPPSSPGAVALPRYTATPTTLALSWSEPADNGSPILHYNVDLGDRTVTTEGLSLEVSDMQPDTTHRVRLQAVNAMGAGPFSPVLRAATLPPPPAPPHLECAAIAHNSLKLRWGDGRNPAFVQYSVEMENPRFDEFQVVYQGTSHSCKVNRLQELTAYRFRIMASNDAGEGEYSDVYEYTTCIAPPPSLKPPRAIEVHKKSCVVEWNPSKPMGSDPIIYQVQLSRVRDQEYKQVYRGVDTKVHLMDLEAGAEYNVRVCPVRQASSGPLPGAYSPPGTFSTVSPEPTIAPTTKQVVQAVDKKPMTDQQYALVILCGFTLFAIVVAAIMQQVIM